MWKKIKCSKLARIRKNIQKYNKKNCSSKGVGKNETQQKHSRYLTTGSNHTVKNSNITRQLPESFMLKSVHRPVVSNTNNLQTQKSPEILVEIPTENKEKPPLVLRTLLDSGSTGCIILNEFTKGLPKKFDKTEKWTTKGGTFTTKGKCKVPMILADFTRSTTVEFDCYVDPTKKSSKYNYDLILGKDFMQELGIDIINSQLMLRWNGIDVPMRNYGELVSRVSGSSFAVQPSNLHMNWTQLVVCKNE
jgi:hypothetical protein